MRDYQSEYDALREELTRTVLEKKASDDAALDAFKLGENFAQSHPIEHRGFIEAEFRREMIANEMHALLKEAQSLGIEVKY